MILRTLIQRNYGGKLQVNMKYYNLRFFKEGVIMSEYPWNKTKIFFIMQISFNLGVVLVFIDNQVFFYPLKEIKHEKHQIVMKYSTHTFYLES